MVDIRHTARAVSKAAVSETGPSEAGPRKSARDFGEVILLSLATVLAVLWSIVLVTHFHGTLSGVGQSLWLMR